MNLPLSKRLLTCAKFVNSGDRVADIGCDHGYLGIYLLQQGIASSVIASDVNQQPLQNAVINAEKFGFRDKMTFFLSDGVKNIPRDFDCMVCAGMGADTMISILEAAPWLRTDKYRMILQCQSKTSMLRKYLSDNGWRIARETVLRDGRFLYTVMDARWEPGCEKLTIGQQHITPALLSDSAPELEEYCRWVVEGLRIATRHKSDLEKDLALKELSQILPWMEEA